ncbi:MAG TPA: zf-HC2 domain-containing protein [Pyrinomonadaceae bacterium]|nr:zf-HC2 domain-containing protein [Pyrinomonadaceae bacterium]
MVNLFQNSSGEKSEHPPREMLLLFVDGELPAKEAAQLETHLEACWPCRVRTKKIQEAIADIIEFDEQVLTPRIVPPQGWSKFDRQLSQLIAATGKQSLTSRLFGSLGRFLPSSHLFALPRPRLSPMLRNLTAVLVVILIVALVIRFKHEPTVSASELLKNAIEAQSRQVQAIDEAVTHQKLLIRRKAQVSAVEESVNWEIWNDTKNSRVRQFLADSNQAFPAASNTILAKDRSKEIGRDVINELTQVLQFNHMDPQRPLSAASYQSWHNTLQRQRDEVTRSRLADGADALILRTIPAAPVNVGQIAEALFTVRAKDWQPTQLRLNVVAQGGNRIYELTETISEIVSLAQVNPAVFADQPIVSPSPAATPKELVKKETQPTRALAPNVQPLIPAPVATAELEVEALRLLNQVGADLGEQISVKRTAAGMLRVTGIVETDQRKSEITNVLLPIASNPAVRIEIQTVAEAVAKQTTMSGTPSPSVRKVEITGNVIAAEPELRAYFEREGGDASEHIRRFAGRIVNRSGRAMNHLWAMKRLIDQFSPEEMQRFSPEARDKWLSLVRSHARAYRQEVTGLRQELRPVFFPGATQDGASGGPEISDASELARAIERLFELSSSNDRVIRSAFTASAGGAVTTAIKTTQFWQALAGAEALAERISRQNERP